MECAEDYGIDLDLFYGKSLEEMERLQAFPFWRLHEGSKVDLYTAGINEKNISAELNIEEGIYTTPDILVGLASSRLILSYLESDSFSAFEVIAIAGFSHNREFGLSDSTEGAINIFWDSLISGEIMPREPRTNIPYNKHYNNKLFPDLSWLFTFDEANQWAMAKFGINLENFREELQGRIKRHEKPTETAMETSPAEAPLSAAMEQNAWPWGTHETKLLRTMAEAAQRFWANYDPADPTTAPYNHQVQEWLESQGVSKRVAETMARILRADDLPPGPRK